MLRRNSGVGLCRKGSNGTHLGVHVVQSHSPTNGSVPRPYCSVDCVAANPTGPQVVTGSWDKSILVWDLTEGSEEPATKRMKKSDDPSNNSSQSVDTGARELAAVATLTGHTQSVSALSWPDPVAMYSGSWDHSIRTVTVFE
eukprot:152548_1